MAPDSESGQTLTEAIGSRTHPLSGLVHGAPLAAGAIFTLMTQSVGGGGMGDATFLVGTALAAMSVLYGFLSWWFTRYVIDGNEIRIHTGIVNKSSRRIPYERIQSIDIAEPFLARLFTLAELRIEMAGGTNARSSLRYLPLDDAQQLRHMLLARAHGRSADEIGSEPHEAGRVFIASVTPDRIIIGMLLSLDFLAVVTGMAGAIVVAVWLGEPAVFFGGFLPLAFGLVQMITGRVLTQWNFSLSRNDDGLRIERGLLARSSQTIPFARVQGVSVVEPLLWRRLGWTRLEVDVAGYAGRSDGDSTDIGSTLLPIADPWLAAKVLDQLITGTRPEEVDHVGVPPRSWPFAPIGWRYRWVGTDDIAFVARSGWLHRTTDVIPHARTQSVELRQGPLARRLGLATVEVHTPAGPVDADGRNLDASDARRVAFEQLSRARRART
jgi:putative membrane protein